LKYDLRMCDVFSLIVTISSKPLLSAITIQFSYLSL
jgi:hypothetical protein